MKYAQTFPLVKLLLTWMKEIPVKPSGGTLARYYTKEGVLTNRTKEYTTASVGRHSLSTILDQVPVAQEKL